MELKYAGFKPMISEHGISFKEGKDDKYVYLSNTIQILDAINHNYAKNRVYHHDIVQDTLSEDEILQTILTYKPDMAEIIESEIHSYNLHLDDEILKLEENHSTLSLIEQTTFKNNLDIMRSYRIQRATNKIVYRHAIEIITTLIKTHRIKDITSPFNERYWHILQTIQGELSTGKESIRSELIKKDSSIELVIFIY